ncbi:cysteine proteinase [Gonapodya prolifera JEL478]|uniref:Ubiquitin carboxyl-terminal hydrolase n=1 Tax=Gonapodya prolifera (strain JEL478) TaxID=1344416 RepID=A0A139AWQ4_GONPJ|nr:cysteine proteinase [Gonapodya prolifera JEL478]|eukprot:KXS20905.1 cysteine proteinase [Gonapodya prolifera JEL478]
MVIALDDLRPAKFRCTKVTWNSDLQRMFLDATCWFQMEDVNGTSIAFIVIDEGRGEPEVIQLSGKISTVYPNSGRPSVSFLGKQDSLQFELDPRLDATPSELLKTLRFIRTQFKEHKEIENSRSTQSSSQSRPRASNRPPLDHSSSSPPRLSEPSVHLSANRLGNGGRSFSLSHHSSPIKGNTFLRSDPATPPLNSVSIHPKKSIVGNLAARDGTKRPLSFFLDNSDTDKLVNRRPAKRRKSEDENDPWILPTEAHRKLATQKARGFIPTNKFARADTDEVRGRRRSRSPERLRGPSTSPIYTHRTPLAPSKKNHSTFSSELATSDPFKIYKGYGPRSQDNERLFRSGPGTTADGFKNLGQTCYINAVLQLLYHLTQFRRPLVHVVYSIEEQQRLLTASSSSTFASPGREMNSPLITLDSVPLSTTLKDKNLSLSRELSDTLAAQLARVFRSKEGGDRVVSPVALKKCIGSIMDRFADNDQEDAHELLTTMLDVVEMDLAGPLRQLREIDDKSKLCFDPVVENFEWEAETVLSCAECGLERRKKEVFRDISLDLPQFKFTRTRNGIGISIRHLLHLFFKVETLYYKCETCPSEKAFAKRRISRVPRVLLVHIKRYQLSDQFGISGKPLMTRRGDPVAVQEHLDLASFCTDEVVLPAVNGSDIPAKSPPTKRDFRTEPKPPQSAPSPILVVSDPIESSDDDTSGELSNLFEGTSEDDRGQVPKTTQGADIDLAKNCEQPKDLLDEDAQMEWALRESAATASSERDQDNDLELALRASLADAEHQNESLEFQANMEVLHDETEVTEPARNAHSVDGTETVGLTKPSVVFDLTSVICHLGTSYSSGHYVCDVLERSTGVWWTFNDDLKSKLGSIDDLMQKRAPSSYILTYQLERST